MAFSDYTGMLTPTDLALVQRVFDRLCDERRLAQKDRDQREELAAEIIRVFQKGATDEADLWRSLSKRRRARDGKAP
ncbi:RNA-binding protein [Mesorhizobium sp. IMUNJ 23232]|uniref:RNA-binding protein n=1 Tax=Mesorhizobium sp. IMUNJ 23232 TaxID=3376064 RepID=UPI0037AE6FB2